MRDMIRTDKRCLLGEGPVWCQTDGSLYFVNSYENEICRLNLSTMQLSVRTGIRANALAFDRAGRMLISASDGVFYLRSNGEKEPLYDRARYCIRNANDMKAGPDGRLYVGTQSSKRLGLSPTVDGALYSIDPCGEVRVLLDGLLLSNGMDWSLDGTRFYHTDSDTKLIREYAFDPAAGAIQATGRSVTVPGVDGFCMDTEDRIFAACWGKGHIAVVNTESMTVEAHLPTSASIPTSCAFVGENLDILAVTSATLGADLAVDTQAGYTFLMHPGTVGKHPFLFGQGEENADNG